MDNLITVRYFPRMDVPDETSWLAAARCGERWALEQFYACYQPQIYTLCQRMLAHSEDAEDAMQAAFVKAFRALPHFRGESSLKTWLYRIAMNEALSVLRKRRGETAPLGESVAVADGTLPVAQRVAVQTALARIKPDHRAILILRFWEELSYEEIAAVLGISLPAVTMRLRRAREEFQKRYEGAP